MKKTRVILIVTILISFSFKENTVAYTIPDYVKEAVSFVFFGKIGDPLDQLKPVGTAFFVSIYEKSNKMTFGYLVTAKHVLLDPKNKEQYLPYIIFRLNDQAGKYKLKPVILQGKDASKIYTHDDDETVDIAVIPFMPDINVLKYKFITVDKIATMEKFKQANIKEGNEVFFTGMFTFFYGKKRNYPIVRYGKVAMMTDEKIPISRYQETFLYLIECQSYGGNSGSPVFFRIEPKKSFLGFKRINEPEFLLAGVLKGGYERSKEIKVIDKKKVPAFQENLGITVVTPAYLLHEILFNDKLKKLRATANPVKGDALK